MSYVRTLTCLILCSAAQVFSAEQDLSDEALLWTNSAMADRFAECSVFFNSMSTWPGMTDEVSLELAELADISTKQMIEYVDGGTAASKIGTASDEMWAPYSDRSDAVPPSAFISKYTARCAKLLSQTEIVLADVMQEGSQRFPN